MLKNMLKSILAIATVCAMSSSAFAESKLGGFVGGVFGIDTDAAGDSTYVANYHGNIAVALKGERTEAKFQVKGVYSATKPFHDIVDLDKAYVTWTISDMLKMSIGSAANEWDKYDNGASNGPPPGSAQYAVPYTLNVLAPGLNCSRNGLGFEIDLSEGTTVFAGLYEARDPADMSMYGVYVGKMGDLQIVAGMKTEGDLDAVMGAGAAYKMGAMDFALNYNMQGDANTMIFAFNMKNVGPGNINFRYQTTEEAGPESNLDFAYAIPIEPGASFEINYTAEDDANFVGVSMSKYF